MANERAGDFYQKLTSEVNFRPKGGLHTLETSQRINFNLVYYANDLLKRAEVDPYIIMQSYSGDAVISSKSERETAFIVVILDTHTHSNSASLETKKRGD